ncbi:hypothetical protein XENOCAPTIV_007975 [Xenoophorus captivus]|uniref:EEF1A lysine methyltransferase 1 n=1 Tax=Xenoophorus captivus TaxID=1517983 RepID=A0ABV0SDZ5_9TELE
MLLVHFIRGHRCPAFKVLLSFWIRLRLEMCISGDISYDELAPGAKPSDDDVPTLSAHTLAALQEFYHETRTRPDQDRMESDPFAVGAVEEDWKLKQGVVDGSDRVSAFVLEYDRRFATYADDFIFYDYNEPLSLPPSVAPQSFDIVLADPPYLSEECLSKVAKTIKYLSKGKVLLCTGAIMENVAKELLDVKMCSFLPKHNRNLSNEFRCFINYPSSLLWS